MAKKIIIDFSAQPVTTGAGFGYTISVDGFDIYYNSGETEVNIEYIPIGGTPSGVNSIEIGANLEETIQKTLDLLRTVYVSDLVFYSIVDNTIEAFVNADATVTVNPLINANIDVTSQDVEPSGINLIYYIIYGDYRLNIYKENYSGGSSEIYGNITINKSSVDSILEPIRGTGLNISLEANQSLTFDEFLLADEFTYKTELLKNDVIIYEGYIKPDGVQQSFVNDIWFVNIESTDGLGALKDLSFVQSNGLRFTGKMSIYDVIKACLDRTRLSLTINTSINLEYTGYSGTNILNDVYVNSERFVKDGNDPVLSDCNEVLTSMLNLFSGVLTQQDGQWWIYRPNDLEANGFTTFINQDTNATFLKNLNKTLGSQINNFYPHHCDNNQQIEVKGAISAYRLNYQYGFINGILDNPNLNHDDDLNYDNWTVNPSLPSGILINDPNDVSGVLMLPELSTFPFPTITLVNVIESDAVTVEAATLLTFNFNVRTKYRKQTFYFRVETSDGYYLRKNGTWSTSVSTISFNCGKLNASEYFANLEVKANEVLNNCDITVTIYRPITFQDFAFYPNGIGEVLKIDILDTTISGSGIVGENHTVSRILPPSSITKENQKVFNGDGDRTLIGSFYKEDLETFTETWNRKGKTEALPILGISAMDDLRIQSSPIKVFSGSVFGEIPYMSVVTIDNVTGLFMPVEWDYDIRLNKSTIKFMQFYNFDLADISYEVSPDYGNSTVKPTIVG
jgi:hypothetical protein